MADIRPFKGVLYNPDKIKDIAKVVTEPYDVISPTKQRAYYKSHHYNIVRLILGKHYVSDNHRNNQYTRAKAFFSDWLKDGILLPDKKENIYIYAQSFPHSNKKKTRTGFIVLLKLEDFAKNTILPHEDTHSPAVEGRRRLLQACRANLSPIFALFSDPQRKVNRLLSQYKRGHRPYISVKGDRAWHRIWRMSDQEKITAIRRLLKRSQIFIADGHHRYEAALNYKRQQEKKGSAGASRSDYVMTYLVTAFDPGLTILPTHRVIKTRFKPAEIISRLSKDFKLCRFSTAAGLLSYICRQQPKEAGCIFGAYFGGRNFYGLRLKPEQEYPGGGQGRDRDLDVNILHNLILTDILKLRSVIKDIYYTRDSQEAIKLVKKRSYQAAFLLRPPTVEQVQRMAQAGTRMPHKTTYFYPKLLTGLVINKLD